MPKGMSNYVAPDRFAKEDEKRGWLTEAIKEGAAQISLSRAHIDLESAAALIAGLTDEETIPEGLSKIHVPEVKRCIKEIVGTLSNFGTLGVYSNDNKLYDQHTNILHKCLESWWQCSFADRQWRSAIQHAAVFGTGYLSPVWTRNFWTLGRGDVELKVYGVDEVYFIQLPRNGDHQKAYAVIFKDELPFNVVLAQWPEFADKLSENHGTATWLGKGRRAVEKFLSPVLQAFGVGTSPREEEGGFPTIDVYSAYILDTTINMGPESVTMGKPQSRWEYGVPAWKSDIPTGNYDISGHPTYRKAEAEDALLYPFRRRIVGTDTCILEDDTSPYWHGLVPLVKVRLDDWAWEHLGYSLIHDVKSIEDSNNKILQAIENSMLCRLDPTLQYDQDSIAEADIEVLDPRIRGSRIATNFQMGDQIKPLLQSSYYDVPAIIPQHVKENEERIRHLLSVGAYQALARAKQIPSGEGIDKIIEAASPIMADQSYGLAREVRNMCDIYKSLVFEFYDANRMMQIGGAEMITPEFWYYDPEGIVPSHMEGEDTSQPSKISKIERLKWHQRNFIFNVATKNLHEITSTKARLMFMQWKKSGAPIDPWTEAEVMGYKERFGRPPKEAGDTMFSRFIYWMTLRAELQQALGGGGAQAGGKRQQGRPSTGQTSPRIVSKEGGTRSTAAESR